MLIAEIRKQLNFYTQNGKKMFATSSFQTHSIPMLHIISTISPGTPIYFINTGFHFPETLRFRDQVATQLKLNLVDLHSMVPRIQQRDGSGNFYFTSDPDHCCFINKTQPMEPLLHENVVWINGIRADQNANRKNMQVEQKGPNGSLRYHPMLNWTSKMIYQYINEHKLPKHPMDEKGYVSIGCEPCTRKVDLNDERSGRWFGMKKTECGLHTDLVSK
ncbi:MAG TPA: phosphoadenylyl-sulfate reductase [Flavobacteriales bacterium]|nr:phosphoadenylyl-sulfate reductase [Flavobacteriales bacterium]